MPHTAVIHRHVPEVPGIFLQAENRRLSVVQRAAAGGVFIEISNDACTFHTLALKLYMSVYFSFCRNVLLCTQIPIFADMAVYLFTRELHCSDAAFLLCRIASSTGQNRNNSCTFLISLLILYTISGDFAGFSADVYLLIPYLKVSSRSPEPSCTFMVYLPL